ncbi:hypothetical protein SGR_5650 [Streptomyces griseus subsp. griseus NBRC 13350]|uniref:Uncharacterized protein n=1 Tax=Streptomyces griseus subsp. griseus (strain JCM 4626 / CBS 651.72 / NBRC 13350 / KCC S-0626 / ISP 5235) TaxID=455632 RepID=B1W1T2_STRGG|nr:hypothetical protein SGR_5650 [Streptomyces griseus subsp. griseus NBRC 13350]
MTTRRTRPAPRPPEGTPPRTELARQARAVLADAVRIAHWAAGTPGPGTAAPLAAHALERAATALELSPAQVRAGWDRARLAGLIELHGDTARPGWRLRAWDRDDSAVLRGWVALFDAWSLVHAAPADIEAGAVAEAVEAVPQVLSLLQLSAGPVTVPALLDLLGQRVAELQEERCEVPLGPGRTAPATPADTPAGAAAENGAGPARSADLNALLLDWALEGLAAVGALTLGNGHATLTPLGNWAVWVKLEQICVAAQSPAGNIEQSAADMLLGCARLTPGPARDEYRAWLAARTVGSAVAELLAVARGEDALLRGLAFEALRVVGAPAEPEVRAVVTEPSLRPYALLWLAEYEGNDGRRPGRPQPRGVHLALGRHRGGRRRPRGDRAAGAPPRLRRPGHRPGPARRGQSRRPPAHRAGPGRPRRGPPGPGPGQGGPPGRLPGAHRRSLSRAPAGPGA